MYDWIQPNHPVSDLASKAFIGRPFKLQIIFNLWKEIFISTEKNNHIFWQVKYFKWRRFFIINYIFLYRKLNPNSGFCHCINTSLIALWNFLSFEFHNWAWNRQHWLFIIWHFSLFTVMMQLQFREGVSL